MVSSKQMLQNIKYKFLKTIITGGSTVVDLEVGASGADTTYTFNPTAPVYGVYYWRVRALDDETNNSCKGEWSAERHVNVMRIDQIPGLSAPTPHVSLTPVKVCELQPTFHWTDIVGETKYVIEVCSDTNFNGSSTFLWQKDVAQNATSVQIDVPLDATNMTYYWRVRGENHEKSAAAQPVTCIGDYQSTIAEFEKRGVNPLDVTVLTGPGDDLDSCNSTFDLQWNAVINAKKYQIQISKDNNNWSTTLVDTTINSTAVNHYVFNPPTPTFGVYYWRIRAWEDESDGTCASNWSLERHINVQRIDDKPLLSAPTPTISASPDIVCTRTPTFHWSLAKGSKKYVVYVSKNPTCTAPYYWSKELVVDTSDSGPFSLIMDMDLETVNTTYYWKVMGYNDERSVTCNGPISDIATFQKKGVNDIVDAASLSPDDDHNTCDPDFTIQWDPIVNATKYQVQIDDDPGFAAPILINNSNYLSTTLTYTPTVPANGTYYWRIRGWDDEVNAQCSTDWTTASVPIRKINVMRIDQIPSLNAPTPNILTSPVKVCTLNPDFSWGDISGETLYKFEIADNAGFNVAGDTTGTPYYWTTTLGANVVNLTLPVDLLSNNKTYYWRVRGENHDKEFAVPSVVCIGDYQTVTSTFEKVGINDPAANLLYADNYTTCNENFTLTWDAVENADKYEIQISDVSDFSSFLVNVNNVATNSYSFTPAPSPVFGTYYWRVRGLDSDGPDASCTPTWLVSPENKIYLQKIESAPSLSGPTPSIETMPNVKICTRTPKFEWSKVVGAKKYHIQVSTDWNFGGGNITWESDVAVDSTLAGPFDYTLTAVEQLPEANADYYWRVKAFNDDNAVLCEAAYSSYSFFRKVGVNFPVTLQNPGDGSLVCDNTPTFEWDAVTNAVNYDIEISKDNFTSVAYSTNLGAVTTYSGFNLPYDGTGSYYWRVKATDNECDGAWSSVWTFQQKGPDNTPILNYPTNNLTICDLTPEFKWTKVTGGTVEYEIIVDEDAGFTMPYTFSQSGITTTDAVWVTFTPNIGDLPNGVDLWWKVRAYNTDCPAAQMFSSTFKTKVVQLTKPTINAPANEAWFCNDEPTGFSWTAVTGANDYVLEISNNAGFASGGANITKIYNPSTESFNCTDCNLNVHSNGKWYWRVAGHNDTCTGPLSDVQTININDMDNDIRQNIWYFNDVSGCPDYYVYGKENGNMKYDWQFCTDNITLTWTASQYGASHYRVQVSKDNTFAGASLEYDDIVAYPTTQFVIPSLAEHTYADYFWRVRAEYCLGTDPTCSSPICTSAWLPTRRFYIDIHTKPIVLDPLEREGGTLGGICGPNCCPTADDQYQVRWQAPTTGFVERYRIQIANNASFASGGANVLYVDDGSYNSTTYNTTFADGGDYYIRVHSWHTPALCGTDPYCGSNWSDTYHLHVYRDPRPFTVNPPDGARFCDDFIIDLNYGPADPPVSKWHVMVAEDAGFSTGLEEITDYPLTTYPFNKRFGPGVTGEQVYYWKVMGTQTEGNCPSPWTTPITLIYSLPDTPNVGFPPDNYYTCEAGLNFTWPTPQAGATDYEFQISSASDFAAKLVDYPGGLMLDNYVPSPDTRDGAYHSQTDAGKTMSSGVWYWRVSAYNAGPEFKAPAPVNICQSPLYLTRTLNVITSPAPAGALNGITNSDNSFSLSWTESENNMDYTVEFSNDGFSTTLFAEDIDGTSKNTAVYTNSVCEYQWRIKTIHETEACESAFSATQTLTSVPIITSAVVDTCNAPKDKASFDLTWTGPISGTQEYTIEISTQNGAAFDANIVESITPVNALTATSIQSYDPSTTYYWRVKGITDCVTQTSAIGSFSYVAGDCP